LGIDRFHAAGSHLFDPSCDLILPCGVHTFWLVPRLIGKFADIWTAIELFVKPNDEVFFRIARQSMDLPREIGSDAARCGFCCR
jgi:hypothetical protein